MTPGFELCLPPDRRRFGVVQAVSCTARRTRATVGEKMMKRAGLLGTVTLLMLTAWRPAWAQQAAPGGNAEARAEQTLRAMQPNEKTILTLGIMPLALMPSWPAVPAEALPGAGYIPGIARLGIPALKETDASLGVAQSANTDKAGTTALPSGVAMAATWNPELLRRGGAMIGAEARAKGFNVLLAGGANLTRDPRNGRTFEYLSEDPLLTGTLVGASISGVQSNRIISTIKHLALNGQETGRKFADVQIGEAAARESDLLAFQIGIELGNPGSVMCGYNRVKGQQACASNWLLSDVLKRDWGYKGFVMSDWGAVPSLDAAVRGLDQQSGSQLDPAAFFGAPLAAKAKADKRYALRLDDMNRRILWAIYANGVDAPAAPPTKIDHAAGARVAQEVAEQAIVLLRNTRNVLPLAKTAKRILILGGYANVGVPSGGGSSQVQGPGDPVVSVPGAGTGPLAGFTTQSYHGSSPMAAIQSRVPGATVTYRDGSYISEALTQAARADVTIIFATKWAGEGQDQPDLTLPHGQDALIAAVAAANPNTIVVLETGNPVEMPWLDKTAAVLEAWYPGARGGEAIASVLFGETNPSGRLPITFPQSVSQLPRPTLDGFATLEPDFLGNPPKPDSQLPVNYDLEGSDVGYRWFARTGAKPLFPFGFGLSYTQFAASGLTTDGATARFTLTNTGARAGATVGQLYLVSRNGQPKRRLVGFDRVELAPGASQTVSVKIDPRLLADWSKGGWSIAAGDYGFALGDDAERLGAVVTARVPARRWTDPR
jgi:beta-glucosidase